MYRPLDMSNFGPDSAAAESKMRQLLRQTRPELRQLESQLRLAYVERTSVELYGWLHRDDNWAGLAAIVDALLAHETLDGEQIEEILEPWWP